MIQLDRLRCHSAEEPKNHCYFERFEQLKRFGKARRSQR